MNLLLNSLKSNELFKNYLSFIENYINSFSLYIKIVKELHMNNLYLFLRNLFIISTINNNKHFLKGLFLFRIVLMFLVFKPVYLKKLKRIIPTIFFSILI